MKWEQCFTCLQEQSLSLPRFGHSAVAVTDPNGGGCQVLIYGGVGCNAGETAQTALGDVAVLQVDSGTWSAPDILSGNNSSSSSPGPRAFHSAVAQNGRMLVFGGHILTFDAEHNRKRRNFYNDIWALDLVDWQWSQLPVGPGGNGSSGSSSRPAKRDMAALLQLQEQQLLLFGGRSEAGRALQDTWLLDLQSGTWEQLKPQGALPPARKMHAMVKVGAQVVLFGGEGDNGPLDDVWVLAGFGPSEVLRWTQLKLRAPPQPRFGHAMAACPPHTAGPAAAASGASQRSSSAGSGSEGGHGVEAEPASPFIAAAAAADAAAGDAAAAAAAAVAADAAVGDSSSSGAKPAECGPEGAAAAAGSGSGVVSHQPRVVVFGGCLDLSRFISLNKNYVQSRETWLLDMDKLMWLQLPQPSSTAGAGGGGGGGAAAAAAGSESGSPSSVASSSCPPATGPWPCERMCHSLTALPDGRLLVIGGRNKEGICRDMWLLDTSGDVPAADDGSTAASGSSSSVLPPPPASPRPSTAGSTGSAAGAAAGAAAKPSPSRPGSQSLLQSLLGPVRARVPSQGLLVRRDSATTTNSIQAAGPASSTTPTATSTPSSSQPASPKRPGQQQQQPQLEGASVLAQLDDDDRAAATATADGAGMLAASEGLATNLAAQQQQQQPPGSSLMDVSSGEFAKLLRNPAAYSAGAINKLSSSVTSTVSSLLVGKDGQPGAMLPRLPEALMRVAPSWAPGPFGARGSNTGNNGQAQQLHQGTDIPPLNPLKQQMGFPLGGGGGVVMHAVEVVKAPAHVLQDLAVLGQQLLTDSGGAISGTAMATTTSGSFAANSTIPTDVLVAAARQHLMSAEALQLRLPHVALLLADYQQLAASYYAHMMLSRLSDGFSAAAAAAGAAQAVDGGQCGSAFLQRQPTDMMINQVQQLQSHYRQLLLQSRA